MVNKILDGLKLSVGFILGLCFFFGIVFAVGFHTADEIIGGNFVGNYDFSSANVSGFVPRGYISGLILSNNDVDSNNDLDISIGVAKDEENQYSMDLSSSMTKQLDVSWAKGTNLGGLFSGSKAINTWYHVFLIREDSTGDIDVGFDTDKNASNIPVGWTSYRRLGSIKTDGSGNIVSFTQRGDAFYWIVRDYDFSGAQSTTEIVRTLDVPPDFEFEVFGGFFVDHSSGGFVVDIFHPIHTGRTIDAASARFMVSSGSDIRQGGIARVFTNESQNVITNADRAINDGITFYTHSWIDQRGQN